MPTVIRKICKADNAAVEGVIRSCLIEFHADHAGTAWEDPDLGNFFKVYQQEKTAYFVAEAEDGEILGGVGIGKTAGLPDVCELQKMYCLPKARGTAVSHDLMDAALAFAAQYYGKVYLETLPNMLAAQRFYEKYGFVRLPAPLTDTGHFACDVCYLKEL